MTAHRSLTMFGLCFLLLFASLALTLPATGIAAEDVPLSFVGPMSNDVVKRSTAIPTVSKTSVTILCQNNLNSTSNNAHVSGLLTGKVSLSDGPSVCGSFDESAMPFDTVSAHSDDFLAQFNYMCYQGNLDCPTGVWLDDGAIMVKENMSSFSLLPASDFSGQSLPQLCTQSDMHASDSTSQATSGNQVIVEGSNGNIYQGYRNKKAFRFLGIPYSNTPARFEYASVNPATDTTFDATNYGAECPQANAVASSENCLFLNIHTPFLPSAGSTSGLRPVLFFIHGGRFISGDGGDAQYSGDNMASREDIVMVSISYRLNTYGFMAVSNSTLQGNYGISDMVSALDWIIDNIAHFGGDPKQITVVGQSAGAAAVRIFLGSSKTIGKFQRAIIMSNLGGGIDLGETSDIGTSNSEYPTIDESFDSLGKGVFNDAGCTQDTVKAQVACLKAYSGDLSTLGFTARFPVQDGTYITTPHLEIGKKGSVANVPIMMGNLENDGASFTSYSTSCTFSADCIAENLGISLSAAQAIIASNLFPFPNTGNLHADAFNVSQLVRTDDTFRCIDQATAYAAVAAGSTGPVYYYQYLRSYGGFTDDPKNVDGYGPASNEYPNGNPSAPYYRLHAGEIAFALGNQGIFRDEEDYEHLQLMTAYWGAFVRTGDPNPPVALLRARGYQTVLDAVQRFGEWGAVEGKSGPMIELNYPSVQQDSFNMDGQCDWLNYTLDYYLS